MYCKIKGCILQSVFLPNCDGLNSLGRGICILNEKKRFKITVCISTKYNISIVTRVEWDLWELSSFVLESYDLHKLVLLSHCFLLVLCFQHFQRQQNRYWCSAVSRNYEKYSEKCWNTTGTFSKSVWQTGLFLFIKTQQNEPVAPGSLHRNWS